MNIIKFEQKRYTIPKNFIDKENAFSYSSSDESFILDSLEIFEIRFA